MTLANATFNSTEERIKDFIDLCEMETFIIDDKMLIWLKDNGFFTAPASTKYHGAYEGGLYDHSRCVFARLLSLTSCNSLVWERKQSPFIVGMFHDLCKCDQYKKVSGTTIIFQGNEITDPTGYHYEYNTNTHLKGHGTKSKLLLASLMTLTEEEMFCIRYHMGAYGNEEEQKTEWAGFDSAIRRYENVLWTHVADQLASKVDDI